MCSCQLIMDALDKDLRTRFICSVDNEVVIKALFKLKDDELTFAKGIQVHVHVTQETVEAARVAKEIVYGKTFKPVTRWDSQKGRTTNLELLHPRPRM